MATKAAATPGRQEVKIHVLYASQTGNSEQAAKDFCAAAPIQLAALCKNVTVTAVHMQMDDFLELERAAWTPHTVLFTSSYGVGQAPLGGVRFRELCDAWMKEREDSKYLHGLSFALCGLGDSKYTTYFQNPTRIDTALQRMGAVRLGPLGKCDASGTGEDEQIKVIARWMDGIWPYLAKAINAPPCDPSQLTAAQASTAALCRQINPDFEQKKKSPYSLLSIVLVVTAVLVNFYRNK